MHLEETIQKIEEKLNLAKGIKNINTHVSNFENKEDNSYIEFKTLDKDAERKAFKFYSRWSKIIRLNCPEVLIEYNTPNFMHNESLRRIIVKVNAETPKDKRESLNQAALHFYQILKDGTKYKDKDF